MACNSANLTEYMSQVLFTVFAVALFTLYVLVNDPTFMQLTVKKTNAAIDLYLVTAVFYVITMLVFKISLALLFLRVTILPWQRRLVIGAAGVSTVVSFAYMFVPIFQCGIPESGWTFIVKSLQNKCISNSAKLGTSYTHAIVVSVTDWLFAVLSVMVVMRLQMKTRVRLTTAFVLLLGTM